MRVPKAARRAIYRVARPAALPKAGREREREQGQAMYLRPRYPPTATHLYTTQPTAGSRRAPPTGRPWQQPAHAHPIPPAAERASPTRWYCIHAKALPPFARLTLSRIARSSTPDDVAPRCPPPPKGSWPAERSARPQTPSARALGRDRASQAGASRPVVEHVLAHTRD